MNKMKKNNFFLFAFLSLLPFSNYPLARQIEGNMEILLKYEDLPKYLSSQDLKLQAQQLSLEAAEMKTGHLRRSFLPNVNLKAGGETFNTEEVGTKSQPFLGAEMAINLYRGNRDKIKDEILGQNVLIEKVEKNYLYALELEKLRSLYWILAYNQEHHNLYQQTVKGVENILGSAKRRIENGLATKTDQVEIQIFLGKLQQEFHEINLQKDNLMSAMNVILGVTDNVRWNIKEEFALPVDKTYGSFLTKGEINFDHHWEILALSSKEKIFSLNTDLNENKKRPTVDLYTEYSIPTQREDNNPSFLDRREVAAGIKLSWNVFDGNQASIESVAKSLERASLVKMIEIKKIELKNKYFKLVNELDSHEKIIQSISNNINLADRFMESTFTEYARGVKGSLEVLEASEKVYDLKHELIKQKMEYQITKSKILSFIEKP